MELGSKLYIFLQLLVMVSSGRYGNKPWDYSRKLDFQTFVHVIYEKEDSDVKLSSINDTQISDGSSNQSMSSIGSKMAEQPGVNITLSDDTEYHLNHSIVLNKSCSIRLWNRFRMVSFWHDYFYTTLSSIGFVEKYKELFKVFKQTLHQNENAKDTLRSACVDTGRLIQCVQDSAHPEARCTCLQQPIKTIFSADGLSCLIKTGEICSRKIDRIGKPNVFHCEPGAYCNHKTKLCEPSPIVMKTLKDLEITSDLEGY